MSAVGQGCSAIARYSAISGAVIGRPFDATNTMIVFSFATFEWPVNHWLFVLCHNCLLVGWRQPRVDKPIEQRGMPLRFAHGGIAHDFGFGCRVEQVRRLAVAAEQHDLAQRLFHGDCRAHPLRVEHGPRIGRLARACRSPRHLPPHAPAACTRPTHRPRSARPCRPASLTPSNARTACLDGF